MSTESKTYEGESFVYEDKEVIKTGRSASNTKTTTRGKSKTRVLVEICPFSMIDKPSSTFHRWVPECDLFTISGTKTTTTVGE